MKEVFYGIGAATLIGLACGASMKPNLVQALTRDGSMTPVEAGYGYDDAVSYAPSSTPVYYDSWASSDQALLQSASYDGGDGDIPSYDPRPAPEDRAEAIRLTALMDGVQAPPPEDTTARYPSADGDILAGLTSHTEIPPLPSAPAATTTTSTPPVTDDDAATGDTRPASPS